MADRIRRARTEKGLRREQLAVTTGLSWHSIRAYEEGVRSPRLASLELIAEATDKPVAWFYEEDGVPA